MISINPLKGIVLYTRFWSFRQVSKNLVRKNSFLQNNLFLLIMTKLYTLLGPITETRMMKAESVFLQGKKKYAEVTLTERRGERATREVFRLCTLQAHFSYKESYSSFALWVIYLCCNYSTLLV